MTVVEKTKAAFFIDSWVLNMDSESFWYQMGDVCIGGMLIMLTLNWSEKSSAGIDHAEEMELLLENYYRLAEDLSNATRELRVLIDDSQSIIFINLDR